MRRWYKRTNLHEKQPLSELWSMLKDKLKRIKRLKWIRKCWKAKSKQEMNFFLDPLDLCKSFLGDKCSEQWQPSSEVVDSNFQEYLQDHLKGMKLRFNDILINPGHPLSEFDIIWKEIQEIVKSTRSVSAPGPRGVPYDMKDDSLLKHLRAIINMIWKNKKVPVS